MRGFPGGSVVENLPAMQKTWIRSLGGEDPLEESMATHSCTLAWRTPCTDEPKGLPSKGVQTVGHDGATKHITAAYAHMMKYCSTVGTKLEQPTHIFKHAVLCHPSFPHGHLCRREGEPQEKPWPRTVWLRQRRGRRGAECAGDRQTASVALISFTAINLNKNDER